MVSSTLNKTGNYPQSATCALLILGPIAFVGALTAFIVGGIGAIIHCGSLGYLWWSKSY